ncbi:glycosyl hydrolase-2 [Coleophoma crateriformis]|uniref:Glycosyl hydrolase-2 n=1 Tax=Coleophoma crateriformis TaxID=565419 RepID=A0A3D8Q7N3_9HELO|nr:glycosyl hydrolase-2 [Coleophoma crateriformis]
MAVASCITLNGNSHSTVHSPTVLHVTPNKLEAYIPAVTTQSHASNLLLLPNGDLLCAWFGGLQEGIPDISIYLARLPANSNTWSSPSKLTHDDARSEQNPVLFLTPTEPQCLWLMYTSQDGGNQDSAVVKKQESYDLGHTWSTPTVLFAEPGTFIRQPMSVISTGAWIIPVFYCRAPKGYRWVGNDDISAIRVSHDKGVTWEEVQVPESYGAVHMRTVALHDGTYLALYRSRWADFVYSSTSSDGIHWSIPQPTTLPNPNSGICADVLPDGRVLLVYNDSSADSTMARRKGLYDDIAPNDDVRLNQPAIHGKEAFWGAPRAPLSIAISNDGGKSWERAGIIEHGDGFCMTNDSKDKLNRELSYPSVAVGANGDIHIAFTFWRQKIKYVRLGEKTLGEA